MWPQINRRGFLHLISTPLLVSGTTVGAAAQAATDALFVLIDDIGPATPVDRLRAFVDPFLDGEIPFGLVLAAPSASDPDLPDPVAGAVRHLLLSAPGRVEPVLSLPGLAGLPRYFQRRAASDGMAWLSNLIADMTQPLPVTIATDAPPFTNFDALRCLGLRVVLNLDAPPPVLSVGCSSLAVCLAGATTIPVAGTADPAAPVFSALDGPGWAQIVFSLAGIGQEPIADIRLRGQRAVDAIAHELERGRRFMALPRDHALWFGEDQLRYTALWLRGAATADTADRSRLADEIKALGIPFGPDDLCPNAVVTSPADSGAAVPSRSSGPICAAAHSPTDGLPDGIAAAIDLLVVPDKHAAFDGRGLLIRGATPIAQATTLLTDTDRMRDAILSIRPEDFQTPVALAATLDALRRLQSDPTTRLVDLPAFLRATVTPDVVFDLLQGSRREAVEPEDRDPLSADDWMTDARQAWTFFDRFSNPSNGLCVDTADVQGTDQWLHRELTMWDLGSLIAAVMAAHELGLIPDAAFIARAELLVRALPVARIAGRLLPSEIISSETGKPLSDDFNACDTGRLLSVLRELDAHPLTRGLAEEKIGRWDLESVVVGKHVHSILRGTLHDRFRSHCAHYTARAFRHRGLDVASPYEVPDLASRTDQEMLLLHAAGDLGALGAEPLLFEALEMGMSEPSSLLAAVLFSAQTHDFHRTGALYCVSEAPLNREPWFTYQGLNVTAANDRWMVNAASEDGRFATPKFRGETALVNSKAAYLWAAYRPGHYATLLARHVRTRARLDGMGFAPGVFMSSGQTMPGYADINTNGVILQAIAFILRGRKPRLG